MPNRGQALQLVARSIKCAKILRTCRVYSAPTSFHRCKSQGAAMSVRPEKKHAYFPQGRGLRYVDLYYLV